MKQEKLKPDYIFETSWEVCNKVGGIHTVISTKAFSLEQQYGDHFLMIGPDVWRSPSTHPEFREDLELYANWRQAALRDGLRFRIGRWDIVGQPIVILLDFSSFVASKDEVFRNLWEKYKLDSLSGQWDYIEPAMFGYAAGKVIEHFCRYNTNIRDRVVAHFHEWLTGTGILYLKDKAPQVGTLFTNHSTVLGRELSLQGFRLYSDIAQVNPEQKAIEFGVQSKYSLEKKSAENADCFTTVSQITANESEHFLDHKVTLLTPNGFEDYFIPPIEDIDQNREDARGVLLHTAKNVLGYDLPEKVGIIATSGRYEFRNKGIDVFIDALGQLNRSESLEHQTLAFILVPANNYGPRKDLGCTLGEHKSEVARYLTHNLHEWEQDAIIQKIRGQELLNRPEDKVKVIFVPAYLNGQDGVLNKSYYELLIGFDLTIFASYYEPWGYTPLESLAFQVPTITTSVAGFGKWISESSLDVNSCSRVIERNDDNYQEAVSSIVERVISCAQKTPEERQQARENAFFVSRGALWKNLIKHYYEAYTIALKAAAQRSQDIMQEPLIPEPILTQSSKKSNDPIWKEVRVYANLPSKFQGIEEIAHNFWWSWNYEAQELFEVIDPKLWKLNKHNPIALLEQVSYERYQELERNRMFLLKYHKVYEDFKNYLSQPPNPNEPRVAYFSMEYGLDSILRIYSGGLGILAGDYLKEASDSNIDMAAVGLLYRHGYFEQQLSIRGEQQNNYESQDFNTLPLLPAEDPDGNIITVKISLPGRLVYARVWQVNVGRIKLYLLDTDTEENELEDRSLTYSLYGGDNEHRLKQEILLGVGGIRALRALGIKSDVYHCNEGHAAFINVERLSHFINDENLTFSESLEIVKGSSLFTTHTPVPAGHDSFEEGLLRIYMGAFPSRLKIDWQQFVNLGRIHPEDANEKFSMSHLAANTSQEMNGVSKLHGAVTREMFCDLWYGYYPEELHVGYVTNGVHYPTWTSKEWRKLYESTFPQGFLQEQSNKPHWRGIHEIEDSKVWRTHKACKKELVEEIKDRIDANWMRKQSDPKRIIRLKQELSDKKLTIGFARRFATYKRAHLLFRDLDRLTRIVNNPECPVQFIFAGKAHPKDGGGQALIRQIYEISNMPEFSGKVIFVENYDISLAKKLLPGVDIWLNTPTRPLEASGTSGMKAVMNGVMNFSVLDGWWVEGYRKDAGWALPKERTYQNQDYQDDLDAETIYSILENEIVPLYYNRNAEGIPTGWVKRMKQTIAEIAPEFTTKRMMDDYRERFYHKLHERSNALREDDYQLAKDIAAWKKHITQNWQNIEVDTVTSPFTDGKQITLGKEYDVEVKLKLNGIAPSDIGIELINSSIGLDGKRHINRVRSLELNKVENDSAIFSRRLKISRPGVFNYGLRLFPTNPKMPHRQDLAYVTWI